MSTTVDTDAHADLTRHDTFVEGVPHATFRRLRKEEPVAWFEALTGDGTIITRVVSMTNTNQWAKAGIMIREGTAANAKHAFCFVTPVATNGVGFIRRVMVHRPSGSSDGLVRVRVNLDAPGQGNLRVVGRTIYADFAAWSAVS